MKNFPVLAFIFAALLFAGCLQGQTQGDAMAKEASPTAGEATQKYSTPTQAATATATQRATIAPAPSQQTTAAPEQKTMAEYAGKALAGSKAKLLEYNKADFEAAKQSGALVVLYFYAN